MWDNTTWNCVGTCALEVSRVDKLNTDSLLRIRGKKYKMYPRLSPSFLPSWPPIFSHLSPYAPLCPLFCSIFSQSLLCNLVLKDASDRQGWTWQPEQRIDGMLLQSGDHTNTEKEGEGFFFLFPFSLVTVWVGLWLRRRRKMENKRGPKLSLHLSSCQSGPHCSKPAGWMSRPGPYCLEAHSER